MTNKEITQAAYARFGSGDIPGLLNLFSNDIDWCTPLIDGAPHTGMRNGIDKVREFFSALDEAENITLFEPSEFITEGDKVVVLGKIAATVKSTNRSYETDWVHIMTVRDGKITNFLEFFDSAAVTQAFQKATGVTIR